MNLWASPRLVKPGVLYFPFLCHSDAFIHHELQKNIAGLFPAFVLNVSVEIFWIAEITVGECLAVRAAKFFQKVPIKLANSMNGLVSFYFMLLWNSLFSLSASESNGSAAAYQKTAYGLSRQNGPHISGSGPGIPF